MFRHIIATFLLFSVTIIAAVNQPPPPHSFVSRTHHVNTSYIEEELNEDYELELSFDNNLCLRVKKIPHLPEKEPKKSKKVPKNKLQKPVPNSRKSIVYHPVISREAVTDGSLVGGALREKRVELDNDDDQGSAAILMTAAAAVTLSPEKESEKDPEKESKKEPEAKRAYKKTLSDGWFSAMEKLRELKFILSPTQQTTPMDGNCLYHVLADQSVFIDHTEARRKVVENILPLVENGTIFWNEELLMIDWIEHQMQEGVFGDAYSLQIAANILERDIVIIPTQKESAHNPMGYILIESASSVHDPIYMLYFEETVFGAGMEIINVFCAVLFVHI